MGPSIEALLAAVSADVRMEVRASGLAALPEGDERGRYAVETTGGVEFAWTRSSDRPHARERRHRPFAGRAPERRARRALGYASTATVFLAFKRAQVRRELDATGFIVPGGAGRKILAATWVSSKWEHRAPAGHVLMRVFLAAWGRRRCSRSDGGLVDRALQSSASSSPSTGVRSSRASSASIA